MSISRAECCGTCFRKRAVLVNPEEFKIVDDLKDTVSKLRRFIENQKKIRERFQILRQELVESKAQLKELRELMEQVSKKSENPKKSF